tara:strand:- start:747 stop:995 length:249 start_codon:yes stop_codon:yes gene_type:complete
MATTKNVYGICDVCGFRYKLRELKKNSYGLMVCSVDYDGKYDLKNHPQNKQKNVFDDENVTSVHRRSPMPETNVTVTDWLPN